MIKTIIQCLSCFLIGYVIGFSVYREWCKDRHSEITHPLKEMYDKLEVENKEARRREEATEKIFGVKPGTGTTYMKSQIIKIANDKPVKIYKLKGGRWIPEK